MNIPYQVGVYIGVSITSWVATQLLFLCVYIHVLARGNDENDFTLYQFMMMIRY